MNVFAYIDPGSGSYLVQVIVAAILGISFYFKSLWAWVKSIFGIKPKVQEKDDQAHE